MSRFSPYRTTNQTQSPLPHKQTVHGHRTEILRQVLFYVMFRLGSFLTLLRQKSSNRYELKFIL